MWRASRSARSTAARSTPPTARARQRGIALIAVLWVLVLLSLLAANLTQTSRTSRHLARNLASTAEARALADGGVYFAIAGLLEPSPERRLALDGTTYGLTLGAGRVLLRLRDERGKIDLNRAPRAVLAGLFAAIGHGEEGESSIVDAILDYRDADQNRRPKGAEDDDYLAAGHAYGARDGRFATVEELRRVLGMTEALYARVAEAVTVHGARRVNRATASALVLRALPGRAGQGEAEDSDTEASESGEESVVEIGADGDATLAPQASAGDARAGRPRARRRRARGAAVSVRAEAQTALGAVFVREAIVRIGTRRRSRSGEDALPYEILSWRQGRAEEPAGE